MCARHATGLNAVILDNAFDGEIRLDESMARHTTYRIGGPAKLFATVHSIAALSRLIEACESEGVEWMVAGKGSNLLVSDRGFNGAVIVLGRDFRVCRFDEQTSTFCVGAGVSLSKVVQDAFRRSLSGMEFAVGTPGTVGGALRMNAGTRREWISSRVVSVTTFAPGRGLRRYADTDLEWGYRTSFFRADEVIVECELSATPGDPFAIRTSMEQSLSRRRESQPLSLPSCGSVFRNPDNASVARLVEQAGLKGLREGGATISPVHANFIVNEDNASASDVRKLMRQVEDKVYSDYGIELQPEVKLVGFSEESDGVS